MKFQSTRPRGARRLSRQTCSRPSRFNPRAHVGRDCGSGSQELEDFVSIHAPTWGATSTNNMIKKLHWFQSTRPRGARRRMRTREATYSVSIHAPTWGATRVVVMDAITIMFQSTRPRGARHAQDSQSFCGYSVSIHAPTWGATRTGRDKEPEWCFNPRAHVGRDGVVLHGPQQDGVSIHAPTWGATSCTTTYKCSTKFQSTRPRGARRDLSC